MVLLTISSHGTSAFRKERLRQRLTTILLKQFVEAPNFGAAVFVKAFQPSGLLATLAVPTVYSLCNIGRHGFYFRAHRGLLPPRVPDMLIIRTG